MSTNAKDWFSAKEVSLLGQQRVAGLPKTESGSRRFVKKANWETRETKGAGGKGGILTEYRPQSDILDQISSFLESNPGFFDKDSKTPDLEPVLRSVRKVEQEKSSYIVTKSHDAVFEQQVGWSKVIIQVALAVRNQPQFAKALDDLHQRVALLTYRFMYLYCDGDLLRINTILKDRDRFALLIHQAYEADCLQRGIEPGSDLKSIPWYQIHRKII